MKKLLIVFITLIAFKCSSAQLYLGQTVSTVYKSVSSDTNNCKVSQQIKSEGGCLLMWRTKNSEADNIVVFNTKGYAEKRYFIPDELETCYTYFRAFTKSFKKIGNSMWLYSSANNKPVYIEMGKMSDGGLGFTYHY